MQELLYLPRLLYQKNPLRRIKILKNPKYGDYSDNILIRAHHLLCIQGFQGKGYSSEFLKNMDYLIKILDKKTSIVKVIDEPDSICSYCPHLKENVCFESDNSEKRIKLMDNITLQIIGLECGQTYPYHEIVDKIKNISFSQLSEICGYCQWRDFCLLYSKLK